MQAASARIEALLRENEATKADLAKQTERATETAKQLESIQSSLTSARSQLTDAQANLRAAQAEAERHRTQAEQLQGQVQQLQQTQ